MDPAMVFEHVFDERTARLREQAERLREELSTGEDVHRCDGHDPR